MNNIENNTKNKIPMSTMIWFSGLSMLGFLATDMYLPAFETIRAEFGTSQTLIGLSLSIFLLGMALGQLVYGPLSDRVGRKKMLFVGMTIFVLSTVVISVSNSIELFLFARFGQALGACCGTVIWQAVVIDRYQGKASERIFATIMPLVALSPALAPLLGAGLEEYFGWRSIFVVLVVIGLALVFATSRQQESAPLDKKQEKISTQLVRDYKQIIKSKIFMGNMLIFAACSAAFFAYLTGSPFIMTAMGYSGADIGLSYLPQTVAFLVGGYGCRSLLTRFSAKQLLPWLITLFITTVVTMFVIAFATSPTTIWPILIPFCFLAVANGAIYPLVINAALADFKNCSATAAGLLNFLQTMFCFLASSIVSAFSEHGLYTVTAVMLFQGLVIMVGYVLTKHKTSHATASDAVVA
ncbi:purine nucleoside transporter PunC [Moritella sp.]|uniref:purine nucleoside transporter PunC n=1 Tax=Moritella sp. TaxID=78556 RepID=UPI001DDBE70E|nr:purine nucleoside transporter PunC [Moritella sp.]MCJ8350586.1 Bcr/CflA family multidrug efflux MFS transporter [Moritella sp.]NQZ41955.1 Bcr/CflA family multidrug efflux MFS transporter [Moritella sp.]